MEKGENLILGELTFDPAGLAFIEFGKNAGGQDTSRQHFKETGLTKDWVGIPVSDLEPFKEFARVNELYREADKVIE